MHLKYFSPFLLLGILVFSSCAALSSRPSRQLSYAEASFQAAILNGAETSQPQLFQLAKDLLLQARAAYRQKNFKLARQLSIKSRHASEEAEYRSLQAALKGDEGNPNPENKGAENEPPPTK